jgi:condensin complex subunit 3
MIRIDNITPSVQETFHKAQLNAAGHRKLIHGLRRLHLECEGEDGEREFFLSVVKCLNVLLAVRKNEEVVNRSLRFLVGFIVLSAERDEAGVLGGSSSTTRFIENMMLYGLEGVDAKDRFVRARLAQVLVACVNAVDELSDHVWRVFRVKMTERLFDKEAAVRVQATHALARLQSLELAEGSGLLVRDVFIELLAHDPAAEVRKAVLAHIDVVVPAEANEQGGPATLDAILQRRRDVDAGVRRHFYANKMSEIDVRVLSMKQRDAVLRAGLGDRDANVRRACIEMVFGRWIQTANNNLLQLLLSLDVLRHLPVAESALKAFYEMSPDMFSDGVPGAYFENLTPETAVAVRVYCQGAGRDRAADLLPELSTLANHMRRLYEGTLTSDDEAARAETEFILGELMAMTELLDGSDEMGRRVLQTVFVEMLANLELDELLFGKTLHLLSHLSPDLDAFLAMVGQLVADLHELYSAPEGPVPLEQQLQRSLESLALGGETCVVSEDVRILAQLRCLDIVGAALQLPGVSLVRYPLLLELLNDAVIPAVNSPYAAVQAKGLLALGLACTLSRELSCEYISLLTEFFKHGQEETRATALKILFDVLLVFGADELPPILDDLIPALYDLDTSVQAVAAEGYAKLLLHRIVADVDVISGLFQLYFHPSTADNTRLRQTLTYCFQVYAFSSASNQQLIAQAFLPVLEAWQAAHPTGAPNMSFSSVAGQLLELTDPARLVEHAERKEGLHAHAILAEELAWMALRHVGEPQGKFYAGLLTKLRIDNQWPSKALKRLLFVTGQLIRMLGAGDKTTLTAMKKIVALLVEMDDPTQLLEPEDLVDLRSRMTEISVPEKPSVGIKPKAVRTKTSALSTTNIMDEITDLLD